ncbi:MAG: hypothetical protein AAB767_01740 [Patescibacteria group bacterium]
MEGVLRWKEVIIKAGIAFCVAVLLLALAYISSRMRLVEPPPAVAHPRVQIPEAERANIAATEERMRGLQSAWAAQVGVATAELKKEGSAGAKRAREIERAAARSVPPELPFDALPGGAFDVNPR